MIALRSFVDWIFIRKPKPETSSENEEISWYEISFDKYPQICHMANDALTMSALKQEIRSYLYKNIHFENFQIKRRQKGYFSEECAVLFRNREDAAMFKLVWC